jgi:hypothetical protein
MLCCEDATCGRDNEDNALCPPSMHALASLREGLGSESSRTRRSLSGSVARSGERRLWARSQSPAVRAGHQFS